MNAARLPAFGTKGLDGFTLKLIALITMTIDHIAVYLPVGGAYDLMRIIGRISLPVFFFLAAWGFSFTRHRVRFLLRLYLMNLGMQLVTAILNGLLFQRGAVYISHSIFATILYFLSIVWLWELLMKPGSTWRRIGAAGVIVLLFWLPGQIWLLFDLITTSTGVTAYPFTGILRDFVTLGLVPSPLFVEGSVFLVVFGVVLYFLREKPLPLSVFVMAFSLLIAPVFFTPENRFFFLALPFMLLYNQKPGVHRMKWLFYLYYPSHVYILYFLGLWIMGTVVL